MEAAQAGIIDSVDVFPAVTISGRRRRVAERNVAAAEREAEKVREAKLKTKAKEAKYKAEAVWWKFGAARVRLCEALTQLTGHEKVAAKEARCVTWMAIKEVREEA